MSDWWDDIIHTLQDLGRTAVLILDVQKLRSLVWSFKGEKLTAHVKLGHEEIDMPLEEVIKGHIYRFTLPGELQLSSIYFPMFEYDW